jgi:hypothetical protein
VPIKSLSLAERDELCESRRKSRRLTTHAAQIEWVGNHAAEIGDPDVVELAREALDGDDRALTEALEFWRLWKGNDEPVDVP